MLTSARSGPPKSSWKIRGPHVARLTSRRVPPAMTAGQTKVVLFQGTCSKGPVPKTLFQNALLQNNALFQNGVACATRAERLTLAPGATLRIDLLASSGPKWVCLSAASKCKESVFIVVSGCVSVKYSVIAPWRTAKFHLGAAVPGPPPFF